MNKLKMINFYSSGLIAGGAIASYVGSAMNVAIILAIIAVFMLGNSLVMPANEKQ